MLVLVHENINVLNSVWKVRKCGINFVLQVIEGGNYDVDMSLASPDEKIIHTVQKQQYDTHTWKAEETGTYRFCFSNDFSTITHKIVYFDFRAGDDDPVRTGSNADAPMTAMTQVFFSIIVVSIIMISRVIDIFRDSFVI